jgi:sirohydrochlorin cobaltochelatase
MAAWLCATIILENVEARCDEERLLVPAASSFALADQVKSVITVVAKTHHYWSAHIAGTARED